MKKELVLKKCTECGALVKIIEDCTCKDCGIKCCGKEMVKIVPNSVDAAVEKHVPTYEVKGRKIVVKVNHVMEEEHFIEWIGIIREGREGIVYLQPNRDAECEFDYEPGSKIYSYCNKHGLWEVEVK